MSDQCHKQNGHPKIAFNFSVVFFLRDRFSAEEYFEHFYYIIAMF